MNSKVLRLSLLSTAAALVGSPAFAASDVSNTPSLANQAVASVAAPVASSQTAGLIGGAIGNSFGGSIAPTGGFTPTGGGTFAPSGGGSFSPSGGAAPGPQSNLLNTRQIGKAGAASKPKIGAWAQGTYVNVDRSEAGLEMDGSVYNLVGGVDYKVTDRVVAGVALGYENVDMDTKFNAGTYEGDGFTVAPYVGVALTPNWTADLSAGYSWLSYDVTRNTTVKGAFDAERWYVSGNLTGNYAINRFRLAPKVGVLYLEEDQDGYTESTGNKVASNTIRLGRATAGAKVGYAFDKFVPYVKVMGEWDFEKPGSVMKNNSQLSNVDDGGLTLGVGVDFFTGTISGGIEASYNSALRDDLDVWQGTAKIRYEF